MSAACLSYTVTGCGNAKSQRLAVYFSLIVHNATVLKPSSVIMEDRSHRALTFARETHFIRTKRGLDRYCYLGRKPLRKTYQRLKCVRRNIVKDKEKSVYVKGRYHESSRQ